MKTIVAKLLLIVSLLFVIGVAFSVVSGTSHAASTPIHHMYKNGGGYWYKVGGVTYSVGHTAKVKNPHEVYINPQNDLKTEVKATKKATHKKVTAVKPVTNITNNYNNTTIINENTEQDETTLPEQYNNWNECYDYYQVCYDTYDGTMLVDGNLYHCSQSYDVCVKDR